MAKQHIVMLPFMAQGHLIPFLALVDLISRRDGNYAVTIVSTPFNVRDLRAAVPPGSGDVRLVALPYRSADFGLPPDTENTDSLPLPSIIRLFESADSLEPHFLHFLTNFARENHGRQPLLIIADVFFGWTVEIARRFNIFHISFTTCGAYGTAAYMSLWLNLPHVGNDLPEFNIPGFPETFKLRRNQLSSYLSAADGTDPWSKFFRRQISRSLQSDAMICNTIEEVETEGLRLLQEFTGLTVWPIGPLLQMDSCSSRGISRRKSGTEVSYVVNWLDSHQPGSVVYVSFGSQNTISASQMKSLAVGLESSGHPFVWVVRPPIGSHINSDFVDEWLPTEFETRMQGSGQGILIRRWAPQLEILSHVSTGAFVSHCGWNSVLESLSRGVCIIGWPLAAEQFYNSKLVVEELEVGTEVARGTVEEVSSEAIKLAVLSVMDSDNGREMKEKAKKYRELIRDAMREEGEVKGSSIRSIDGFIDMAILSRSTA